MKKKMDLVYMYKRIELPSMKNDIESRLLISLSYHLSCNMLIEISESSEREREREREREVKTNTVQQNKILIYLYSHFCQYKDCTFMRYE